MSKETIGGEALGESEASMANGLRLWQDPIALQRAKEGHNGRRTLAAARA